MYMYLMLLLLRGIYNYVSNLRFEVFYKISNVRIVLGT